MKTKTILFSALLLIILASAYSKYSEGPTISLRSKSERMANSWIIKKAFRNGNDVTSDYSTFTLSTTKEGNALLNAKYNFAGISYEVNTAGIWTFNASKKNVIFDYENNDADNRYLILRLKEDELWIRDLEGSNELQLQPS